MLSQRTHTKTIKILRWWN